MRFNSFLFSFIKKLQYYIAEFIHSLTKASMNFYVFRLKWIKSDVTLYSNA